MLAPNTGPDQNLFKLVHGWNDELWGEQWNSIPLGDGNKFLKKLKDCQELQNELSHRDLSKLGEWATKWQNEIQFDESIVMHSNKESWDHEQCHENVGSLGSNCEKVKIHAKNDGPVPDPSAVLMPKRHTASSGRENRS